MCVDNGSIVGPLVMFLLINLLYWPLKYFGLHKGYEMGMELVEKAGVQVFDRLGNLANVLGVMVTGGLIATTVKLKLAVQFRLSVRVTRWCSRTSSTRCCPSCCLSF